MILESTRTDTKTLLLSFWTNVVMLFGHMTDLDALDWFLSVEGLSFGIFKVKFSIPVKDKGFLYIT